MMSLVMDITSYYPFFILVNKHLGSLKQPFQDGPIIRVTDMQLL